MSVVLFHHFVSTILVNYVILVFASPPLAWKLRKVLDIAWSFSVKIFQALIWFPSHSLNVWKFKFPLWRREIYSRITLLWFKSCTAPELAVSSWWLCQLSNLPQSESYSKIFTTPDKKLLQKLCNLDHIKKAFKTQNR